MISAFVMLYSVKTCKSHNTCFLLGFFVLYCVNFETPELAPVLMLQNIQLQLNPVIR